MTPFRTVAAYAPAGVTTFGLGVVGEVFGRRMMPGVPEFDLQVCTDAPGAVRTDLGLPVRIVHGLDCIAGADLVLALPADAFRGEPSGTAVAALQAAHARGAIVASHCVGAFTLAAAGLLDGLRVATHWRFAADLASRYPDVTVDPTVLYIDAGPVVTGAGAAAGIDMCLHLVRREHGASVANLIARDLVVPPHRHGGQAQYVTVPPSADTDDDRLARVLDWARENLHRRLTIDVLAAHALTSRRTFIRRFTAATGATPQAWIQSQRLQRAEELLETTDESVEQIARRVGYAGASALREHFVRVRGVPPRDYRRTFRRVTQ